MFLTLVYLLEFSLALPSLPSGAILCSFEVILSAFAAFKLTERNHPQQDNDTRNGLTLLSFFFGLLAVTDGAYMFLFYLLKLPRTTTLAVTFCTIPYSIAFLSCTCAIVLLNESGRNLFKTWKASILPLALSVPILIKLLRFLVPVLFTSYIENGTNLYLLAKLFNTFTSFLLINTALAVLINTRDKYWSLFSVGIVFIVLVNWTLETQNLNGIPFDFGFFEFFWAAGIMLCMFSIPLSKKNSSNPAPQKGFSLVSHYRQLILIIVSVFLVVTHLLYPMTATAIRTVAALTALGCLTAVFLSQFLAERIISLVSDFGKAISKGQNKPYNSLSIGGSAPQLTDFPVELRDNLQAIITSRLTQEMDLETNAEVERQKIRNQANEKLSQLAAQFAHDIRSPIAALDTAVGSLLTEPDDTSQLIRTVAARINDIANSLLKEHTLNQAPHKAETQVAPRAIWNTIESVVLEKRTLFSNNIGESFNRNSYPKVQIELNREPNADRWLAKFQPIELERVLSNLINNSFDSLSTDTGKICVSLHKIENQTAKSITGDFLKISVSDNGSGIPSEIIPKLMNYGTTFGKLGGTGLGLYHARQSIESWGGKITIESLLGSGTTVTMTLPAL
jgi:signal transduction histidine kinase